MGQALPSLLCVQSEGSKMQRIDAEMQPSPWTDLGSGESVSSSEAPASDSWLDGRVVQLVAAAWLTAVLFALWPAFINPSVRGASTVDASVYALAGDLIRRGGTPYVTFWDHKPPLIYLVDAAALAASGGRTWGLWLATWAAVVLAVVIGYRAMRRMFGAPGAMLGTVYFAFSLPLLFATNMPEGLALPLQWGCMLVLANASVNSETGWFRRGLIVGVLGALAFLFKPTLIGAALSVALVFIIMERRRGRKVARAIAGGLVGAGVVCAVMLAYLVATGAFSAFREEVFHYNAIYSVQTTWSQRIRVAVIAIARPTAYGSLAIPGAAWILGVYRLARRRWSVSPGLLVAVIWLPIELAFASISGRPYAWYFTPLLAPFALLAASFASELTSWLADRPASDTWFRSPDVVTALSVALAISAAIGTAATLWDDDGARARAEQVRRTAAYIRAHTRPSDHILVWGQAADVYLLSGRPPASRFIFPQPLLTPGYTDSTLVDAFISDIRSTRPAMIIDVSRGNLEGGQLSPSLDRWDPSWQYPEPHAYWAMAPALKRFYDFVAAKYVQADTVGQWVVYTPNAEGVGTHPSVLSRSAAPGNRDSAVR